MKFNFTFILTIITNTAKVTNYLTVLHISTFLVFEADMLLDSLVKLASVLKSLAEIWLWIEVTIPILFMKYKQKSIVCDFDQILLT